MILLADSEGPDQTARMRKLIWAYLPANARRHICARRSTSYQVWKAVIHNVKWSFQCCDDETYWYILTQKDLSRNDTKRTFWHVRSTKTLISLRIRSVFVVRMMKLCIICHPKCAHWRFRSDCATAQAALRLASMPEGTFPDVAAHLYTRLNVSVLNIKLL